MADDLDEVVEPDELADEELGELPEDELLGEDLDEDLVDDLEPDDEIAVEDLEVEIPIGEVELVGDATPVAAAPTTPQVEEGEEDEEDVDDEDVEASLDQILKERLVVEEEEDEDEEVPEPEDRSEISERVLPKQADEFVCRSCFLVKHSSQLADPQKGLCRDCV